MQPSSSSTRTTSRPAHSRCAVASTSSPGSAQPSARAASIASSTGNHGQSIAYGARLFGVKATICVPEGANPVKVAAMRDLGAEIIPYGVRLRRDPRARRAAHRQARLPLRPLGGRAAAHRRRRDRDARAARGRAAHRHDHRPGRRRQRRSRRVHRREDSRSVDPRDRCAVGCALPPRTARGASGRSSRTR